MKRCLFHRYCNLAPLGDKDDRWFKMCEKCARVKIVNER